MSPPDPADATGSEVGATLRRQRALLEAWVQSPEALQLAGILIRRRGLEHSPAELVSEAWLRIIRSFENRTEPLPSMAESTEAARYGARIIDNLCRDHARRTIRRRETSLDLMLEDRGDSASPSIAPIEDADARLMLEQVLLTLGRTIEAGFRCPGCPNHIAASTALEVIHMVLAGEDGDSRGRTWLDQLMYVALEKVDPQPAEKSPTAQSQRKSRCGRCVTELLNAALKSTLGGSQ
jgi:DNA-directed RNA polymerase specialized sigma24 family protein